MEIMGKMVRMPAGNITNLHYNFVVAKLLVIIVIDRWMGMRDRQIY